MAQQIEVESTSETTPWEPHERLFFDRLGERLDRDDFTEYSARRVNNGKQVFSHTRVY